MKIINQNIFQGKWDVLIHCCNIYRTFGAGIAKTIKNFYPEAYQADLATAHGDPEKMGHFSFAQIEDQVIVNLYAQQGIGNDGNPLNRNCLYDKLYDSLYRFCSTINKPTIIAAPKLGSGLAGGDWRIIQSILESIENEFANVEFHVYYL
jgi:O-acetyl-ADP-ribose deacetylase (regulator of RNase III)